MSTNLTNDAIRAIQTADFRPVWAVEVRQILVRAAKTEGDLPEFAVKQVRWALKQARQVESRLNRDIAQAEALAPRNWTAAR